MKTRNMLAVMTALAGLASGTASAGSSSDVSCADALKSKNHRNVHPLLAKQHNSVLKSCEKFEREYGEKCGHMGRFSDVDGKGFSKCFKLKTSIESMKIQLGRPS
jgi:hypothetical protein